MGMSASQARFLELTARKSNVEYQAQRINFERLQLAEKQSEVSRKYNEAISNQKLVFSYNTGEGISKVDITYKNYKNYMNQQLDGIKTTQQKMFLVSSSGNKIITANEEDMKTIIDNNKTRYSGTRNEVLAAKEEYAKKQAEGEPISARIKALSQIELPEKDDDDKVYSIVTNDFEPSDFIIVDDLDDVDNFQNAISEGIYLFATYGVEEGDSEARFKTTNIDSTSTIEKEYDKTDDKAAQAEYDYAMNQIQIKDKKLELELNKLNSEREALSTEMESVEKVLKDNVDSTFKVFS